ncbi:IlGF domain-containing protein [Meloidogyne graminicola]|uniref:IlGF domain-containing protein n=1 Tax=Meloidogyne graminicola TaxID=189291 RepID=A0A8S9ZKH8_9BILA|nr:IlGF domain-containing protein [Meloidogyne graminicola]
MEIINLKQQTMATTTQRRLKTLLFLFSLLFLTTPTTSNGGFRLCGLKLTMTLNAICKNQLCGGYIMTKRSK